MLATGICAGCQMQGGAAVVYKPMPLYMVDRWVAVPLYAI